VFLLFVEGELEGRGELFVELELELEAADLDGLVEVDFDGERVGGGGAVGEGAAVDKGKELLRHAG